MKKIIKLIPITMFIGISMTTSVIAQMRTNNYVGRWNSTNSWYEDPATIIYVNGTGLSIGTASPQQNLSVNNAVNLDQSGGNTGTISNSLTFGSSSGEGIG